MSVVSVSLVTKLFTCAGCGGVLQAIELMLTQGVWS